MKRFLSSLMICFYFISDNVLQIKTSTINTDFIVNGNFSQNNCLNDVCKYNQSNFTQEDVIGWNPKPQIEIGNGSIYNDNLGTDKIIELNGNLVTCISQTLVNLPKGKYSMTILWCARKNRNLLQSSLKTFFNGSLLYEVAPLDYTIQSETTEIDLPNGASTPVLKLCALGTIGVDRTAAPIITNVQFIQIQAYFETENDSTVGNQSSIANETKTEEKNIYEGYSEVQIQTLDTASQVLNSTSMTAAFTAITFTFLPFSALFIKLISFWTVCSFYALVDIDFPQYLKEILTKVFKVINISLLEEYEIMEIPALFVNADKSNEKLAEDLITKYGLTSDFVTLNFENCCMVAFSLLLLTLLNCLSKVKSSDSDQKQSSYNQNEEQKTKKQKGTRSQKRFDIDIVNLASGQLLSLAPMFMIGVLLLKGKSDFQNGYEKLNLLLFVCCIGFSLCLPFFYISYRSKQQSQNELRTKKKALTFNQNTIKALTVLFFYSCNITVPFMAVLNYPQAFISANFVIFGLGIFCAWKTKYTSKFRKVNSIVLSLWLMLIHVAATVMHFLSQNDYFQINHYAAMAFIGFMALGAVHELLNFLFIELLYDGIYTFVKKVIRRSNRVQDFPRASKIIDFQKETIEKHQNPIIKRKKGNSMIKAKKRGNKNSKRKNSIRNDDENIYKKSRFQPRYVVRIKEQKKKFQIEDIVSPAPTPWIQEFANKNRLKIKRGRVDSQKKREQQEPMESSYNETFEQKIDRCVQRSKNTRDSPKKQRPSDSKDEAEKRGIPHTGLRQAITFKRSLQQRANKLRALLTAVQNHPPI